MEKASVEASSLFEHVCDEGQYKEKGEEEEGLLYDQRVLVCPIVASDVDEGFAMAKSPTKERNKKFDLLIFFLLVRENGKSSLDKKNNAVWVREVRRG